MKANLDNQAYFDNETFKLQIKSTQREVIEKTVAGLDGTVSVDMGRRQKQLIQTGQIRAANIAILNGKIEAIEKLFNGQLRTLITPEGRAFEDVRIDSFTIEPTIIAGASVSCQCKIIYSQLG